MGSQVSRPAERGLESIGLQVSEPADEDTASVIAGVETRGSVGAGVETCEPVGVGAVVDAGTETCEPKGKPALLQRQSAGSATRPALTGLLWM